MVVMILENASEKLRGELTRWTMEAKPGIFIGNLSAVVREKLWDKISEESNKKGAVMFYSADSEEGFAMKMCGEPHRRVTEEEGIQLVSIVDQ